MTFSRWVYKIKKRLLGLLILVLISVYGGIMTLKTVVPRGPQGPNILIKEHLEAIKPEKLRSGDQSESRRTESNEVCRLPSLDPNDPTLAKFYQEVSPLVCGEEANWVYVSNRTIYISSEAVKKHGEISCKYTEWKWKTDHSFSEKPYDLSENGTKVVSDFFQADCTAGDGAKFRNYYSTIIPNKATVARALNTAPLPNRKPLNLNVYVFALESMSRMHVMKKLPKTFEFIKSLDSAIFEGYNIVGDGTPQALIPILTGKTEEELPLTRKRFFNATFVDVYPWIFKDLHKNGYITMYGEDAFAYGTFQYRLKGFEKQPTDHLMRTFYMKAEANNFENLLYKSRQHCLGSLSQHEVFFQNAEDFFKHYPSSLKKFVFMFFGQRLSHDDVNDVQMADEYFAKHLATFRDSEEIFNNTMLVFLADHGNRFAKIRATHQGQLEERMPLFAVSMPEWFRREHAVAWDNMKKNTKRLVSPFDIHATFKAILDWRQPEKADLTNRGVSLFDEIPPTRSCQRARIDAHWCVCLRWSPLPITDVLALKIAHLIVEVINKETERERQLCAPLALAGIESAQILVPHENLLRYKNVKDTDGFVPDLSGDTKVAFANYQLRFRTTPRDALYEATVEYDARGRDSKGKVTVDLATVSHINKYGDAPHCVIDKDYFLAKWCVCYDKIKALR